MRVCSPHCGVDPETTSGGETYERELLRHLGAQGVVLDILLARHKRHPDDLANWVVHRLPIGRGLRWPVAALVLPSAIKRVYDQVHFDLLRVHSLRYNGPGSVLARRWYGLDVPIVAHHHHLDPSPLNRLIERRVVLACERVITVSEFSRRQLGRELGVPLDHVSVVANGVDPRFAPGRKDPALAERLGTAGRRVALFLGGLKPRKNLAFLLELWREVRRRRVDAVLCVVGSGPMETRLRRDVARLGLQDAVVFAGRVPEAAKVEYYRLADVFVFPSALEGFGLAVAEAMSCGLPVVVSDSGALPEVVAHGAGGFVCGAADTSAFVGSILRLFEDDGLRRRFGRQNVERVDARYRWDRVSAQVAAIYDDVLIDWKRRPRP